MRARSSARPWRRALHAWNTLDYRGLQSEKNLTLIEKIALFKAEGSSIDLNVAWERIGERQAVAVPDFVRLANGMTRSIEVGHVLIDAAVDVGALIRRLEEAKSGHGTRADVPQQLDELLER